MDDDPLFQGNIPGAGCSGGSYILQHIDSNEVTIGDNLNAFCRLHRELNRDCMYRVKNGKQKLHKGWFNPELTKPDELQKTGNA
jgi:hypothetical protein